VDYSPQVQPVITTPGHGALPSGHCVEAYIVKEVLQALLGVDPSYDGDGALRRQFSRIAARIATNRVIAGVHFPIDNVAGRLLGTVLGRYFAFCCGAELPPKDVAPWHEGAFLGELCDGDVEFEPESQSILDRKNRPKYYGYEQVPGLDKLAAPSSVLQPLWNAARAELRDLNLLRQRRADQAS
jgi:hypothetical protein